MSRIVYSFLDVNKKEIWNSDAQECFGHLPEYIQRNDSGIRDSGVFLSLDMSDVSSDNPHTKYYLEQILKWYSFGDIIEEKSASEIIETGRCTIDARKNNSFRTYMPLHFARLAFQNPTYIREWYDRFGKEVPTDPIKSLHSYIKAMADFTGAVSYNEFPRSHMYYVGTYQDTPSETYSLYPTFHLAYHEKGFCSVTDLLANNPERIFEPSNENCPTIFEPVFKNHYRIWWGLTNAIWKLNNEALAAGEKTKTTNVRTYKLTV